MSLFGRRSREFETLEHTLRHDRPRPSDSFVDEMLGKLPDLPAPPAQHRSRPRLALATAFALVTVVVFAAFGGLGYAKSGATNTVKSTTNTIASFTRKSSEKNGSHENGKKNDDREGEHHGSKPGHDQYDDDDLVCHRPPGNPNKPVTISVSTSAIPAHLAHGDSRGRCHDDDHHGKKDDEHSKKKGKDK